MNPHLYASPNTVYTVTYDRKSMTIYKMDRPLYTWEFSFQDFLILGISNYGNISCIADDKFYVFEKEGHITGPVIQLSPGCESPPHSIKCNMKIDDKGIQVCYERITEKSFLSRITYQSEIYAYNLHTGQTINWWGFTKDNKQNLDIDWSISKELNYITFLEKFYISIQKDYYKLHLLDVKRNSSLYTIQINDIYEPALMITSGGQVILHCHSARINRLLTFNTRGEKYELILPNSFHIFASGKNIIAIKHSSRNQFIFISTDKHSEYTVDLTILDNHEIEHNIFIKDNDEIALIYRVPGEKTFRRLEAPLDDFLIHIKRWQLVLKDQEKQKNLSRKQQKQEEITVDTVKARLLTQSALKHHNIRKDKIYSKVIQIDQLMSKLNEQFIFQSLHEIQYKENRAKLVESLSRLEEVARRFGMIMKEEDFPSDLTVTNNLKKEIDLLRSEKKIPFDIYKKWEEKVRLMKIKEKEKKKMEGKDGGQEKQIKAEEEQKVMKLLELLEERLIKGEISETLFLELRDKYNSRLELIRNKPSQTRKI